VVYNVLTHRTVQCPYVLPLTCANPVRLGIADRDDLSWNTAEYTYTGGQAARVCRSRGTRGWDMGQPERGGVGGNSMEGEEGSDE
jgi:hypothetical protein